MPIYLVLLLVLTPVLIFCGWRLWRRKMRAHFQKIWAQEKSLKSLDDELLNDIAAFWQHKRQTVEALDQVDDITWNDLNMDAVLRGLDSTVSLPGSEVLYAMLRHTGEEDSVLQQRQQVIAHLSANQETRLDIQMALRKIRSAPFHGAIKYLFDPQYFTPAYHRLLYALAILTALLLLAGLFFSPLLYGFAALCLVNIFINYRLAAAWRTQEAAVRHIASVMGAGAAITHIKDEQLQPLVNRLAVCMQPLKPIRHWAEFFTLEGNDITELILLYLKMFFLLDAVALCAMIRRMQKYTPQLRQAYELVGTLDACIAVAAWRTRCPAHCVPQFGPQFVLHAQQLTHPLIRDCVPNTLDWHQPVLLTGSNASGKSTFLKAVAINAILAQTIMTCTAQAFTMPRTHVITSMAIRDDVQAGESYFIRELKSIRRIFDAAAKRPLLCFIDEILRGTNTMERIAASAAVLEALAALPLLCMAATHDIELTAILEGRYANMHFREEMCAGQIIFNFQLHDGPSQTRNAIALLASMGFPERVSHNARQRIQRFSQEGRWAAGTLLPAEKPQ